MEIEICNVIHNVCHTGGKLASVTVLWAAQHGFKTRPGLVFQGTSRAPDVLYLLDPPSVPVASCWSTDVSLYWMLCLEFHAWDAMALLVLAFFTSALRSGIHISNCLPVYPMYIESHSQGIWYTMPFHSSRVLGPWHGSGGSLGLWRS